MTGVRALQSIATLHPAARQAEAHLDGTVEVLVEALPGIQAEHLDLWSRAGHEGHTVKVTQWMLLLFSPSLIAVSAAAACREPSAQENTLIGPLFSSGQPISGQDDSAGSYGGADGGS